MAIICPTVLAETEADYKQQIERVAPFAHRIQIDLTDGIFADQATVSPEAAWWPAIVKADFHLMYKFPLAAAKKIIQHKPHMIIVQAESEGDFEQFAKLCRQHDTKVGVALLQPTSSQTIMPALKHIDHVLIFSGDLGHFGGQADLGLLEKVKMLKQQKPELEIGWDGGVNEQNIAELVLGGVDILNVGGHIQNADDPRATFQALQRIADETGTT